MGKQGEKTLGKKETSALAEFKSRLKDSLPPDHDDHYLLKWLRARNFDVNKTVLMYETSMVYREKMKVDTILQDYEPPEVLQKYIPGGFCGFDKEGSPVLVELYGHTDMKGILYSAKTLDIEKIKLQLGERVMKMLEEQSKRLGRPVDGMTVIIDMENCGSWMLWGPGRQRYAHMGRVLQDNYPEIVKRSFIVNAPKIFPMLWKIIRPLITEEMKRKVCILGSNYKQELVKYIDADQLPAFLGGTQTDVDGNPRCAEKICQGGTVPERYYLKDQTPLDMQTDVVGRGEKIDIKIKVDTAGAILRWEFKTDGYDIGFGIRHRSGDKGPSAWILPIERMNSHFVPQDGIHKTEKTGTYVFVFDNSYSWTRSKTIYYNIDVLSPEDDTVVQDIDQVTQGGSWMRISDITIVTHL